jgi:cation diffusion facilitator family transporter
MRSTTTNSIGGVGAQEENIRRAALGSLMVNLGLVGAKLLLSSASGSLALRADAVHSLVDVFASTALILGLAISSRKSESFPYGLYKVENMVSVIISLLLFLTAYEIALEAIKGGHAAVSYGGWVLVAAAALIPVPFIFGRYEMSIGKKANSPSLVADGSQFMADVLTSSLVFLALLGQRFGFPLDRYAAVIIAIFVIRAGWEILVSGMRVLLDASVDASTLEKIRSLIREEPAVSAVREVIARNSGRYLFIEAHAALRITDLSKAHLASQKIEERIRRELPNVDHIVVHYEPRSKDCLRYAVPLAGSGGEVGQHFGESPYFALIDIDLRHVSLQRQEAVANPHSDLSKGKGLRVAEFLLSCKPDVILTRENLKGRGPGYAFAEAGVETLQTDARDLNELIEELLSGLKARSNSSEPDVSARSLPDR